MKNWNDIEEALIRKCDSLDDPYKIRLQFELSQIESQGCNKYWVELVNSGKKYKTNKNKLLIPYLLDLVEENEDPLSAQKEVAISASYKYITEYISKHGKLPDGVIQDRDMPDVDIDCLPTIRDELKEYALQRFGNKRVCSVGTVQTYLLKQAMIDSARVLEFEVNTGGMARVMAITKMMPENVDHLRDSGYSTCKGKITSSTGEEKECKFLHNQEYCPSCGSGDTDTPTFHQVLAENEDFKKFYEHSDESRKVVDTALQLVGRSKTHGKHAGALIIADRDLFGNVPMYKKDGHWVSLWTEGRNPQLSKLGYNKWDILGLQTLEYINTTCKLIKKNHGVDFGDCLDGWEGSNPIKGIAGLYWTIENGEKVEHKILLNDEKAIKMAHDQKVDSVFQFDTSLAKSILANGVTSFNDLLVYNALGHPGPLQCIPHYSDILTEAGSVKISKLAGEKIAYLSSDGVKFTDEYEIIESGEKVVYTITYEDGSTIDLTADHLVLTNRGYVECGKLTPDDEIIKI